jgi:hypothetical protein
VDCVNDLIAGLLKRQRDFRVTVSDVWLKGATGDRYRWVLRLFRIRSQRAHVFKVDTIGDRDAHQ